MTRLYIHRVNLDDGKFKKVPENRERYNLGIEYRIEVKKTSDKTARVLGWETGYPMGDDSGANGEVYAPNSFKKGELVFISLGDLLLEASKYDMSNVNAFLESLEKAQGTQKRDFVDKKFSLVGELLYNPAF